MPPPHPHRTVLDLWLVPVVPGRQPSRRLEGRSGTVLRYLNGSSRGRCEVSLTWSQVLKTSCDASSAGTTCTDWPRAATVLNAVCQLASRFMSWKYGGKESCGYRSWDQSRSRCFTFLLHVNSRSWRLR